MEKKVKNKLKVYVYAIAKNESKFVDKWVDSMSEADGIYVMLDGTTSDNTEQLLKQRGVHVTKKIISPWRFDVARNESLNLVPKNADVCVCTDLDEIFSKGWRQVIEKNWIKGETNQAIYKFWHNAGSPDQVPNIFDYSKIHDRNTFAWKWTVHEYIVQKDPNKYINTVYLDGMMLYHYPDGYKPRSYKKLLEMGIKEDPLEIRYQQLLTEEYVNANELNKASRLINKMFKNPRLVHPSDIGMAYKMACLVAEKKQDYNAVKYWCYQALSKVDNSRWFYAELGDVLINHFKDYKYGISLLNKSLEFKQDVIMSRETEWKDPARVYNLIAVAYYYLSDLDNAIKYADLSISKNINPGNSEMYENNKKIYLNAKKELKKNLKKEKK